MSGRVEADSAGTHGWHVGCSPDPRAVEAAAKFGVDIGNLRARRVNAEDYRSFDRIVAMDRDNLRNLRSLEPGGGSRAELGMLARSGDGGSLLEVPDPYYGSFSDFEYMCRLLDEATRELALDLERELGAPE